MKQDPERGTCLVPQSCLKVASGHSLAKIYSGGSREAPLIWVKIWVKKEEMVEWRKANRASKSTPHPPPPLLAQGLDLPLGYYLKTFTQNFSDIDFFFWKFYHCKMMS